nr:unnamed protein product [Digitaria exilis]
MDCNAQVLEGAVGGGGSNGGEKGKEKEQRNVEEELSTGVGAEPPFHVENPERRLVMHGGGEGELSGDEEEEFVFDDDGEEETGKNRWMAVARFYSGRIVKAKWAPKGEGGLLHWFHNIEGWPRWEVPVWEEHACWRRRQWWGELAIWWE